MRPTDPPRNKELPLRPPLLNERKRECTPPCLAVPVLVLVALCTPRTLCIKCKRAV